MKTILAQFYSNYELFGFKKLNKPLESSVLILCYLQLFFYVVSIALAVFYISKTREQNLNKDSEILKKVNLQIDKI